MSHMFWNIFKNSSPLNQLQKQPLVLSANAFIFLASAYEAGRSEDCNMRESTETAGHTIKLKSND